jgi:crotonobetainyl-CoA:carnitine CoA-transferase CaiB-like acyl-CoA transferase
MSKLLEGIKVLDVSQVAAVPMAARILADRGADVIHVENPKLGDQFRHLVRFMNQKTGIRSDVNYIWEQYNRNKKGITLDLSQEAGQAVLHRLVESMDVFLTNLRPFELERFRMEYPTLSRINPRLVAGFLTGFGKEGPDKDLPAYDHVAYWARSGIPHRMRALSPVLQGEDVVPPAFMPAFGDHTAGMSLACGVMMALFARERTGKGDEVHVSLFHSGAYQISFDLSGTLVTGEDCPVMDSYDDAPNALYGQYQSKDGRWVLFSVLRPDRYWSRFCRAVGREDLEEDPRFHPVENQLRNRVELRAIIQEIFGSKTLAEWRPILDAAQLPWAPVQSLLEVIDDRQARPNGLFIGYEHPEYGPMEGVTDPIKLAGYPESVRLPAPEFSQHTEEILLEYGYSWEDLTQLREQGVIF